MPTHFQVIHFSGAEFEEAGCEEALLEGPAAGVCRQCCFSFSVVVTHSSEDMHLNSS
jgi:hypothetical protein